MSARPAAPRPTPGCPPPLSNAARLVLLYRTHGLAVGQWPTTTVDPTTLDRFIRGHLPALCECLAIAHAARGWMPVPVAPATTVAYLLGEAPTDADVIARFLAPDSARETLDHDDPRVSLRRVCTILAGHPDTHADHEYLAFALKAWNMWVTGCGGRHVSWTPDEGMPRIAAWPRVSPVR